MANLVELTEENFEEKVLKSTQPVMVDFSSEWCAPCKRLGPIVEEIADEYAGKAVVAHIDVDSNPEIARKYRILSIPTLLFFKNGELKEQEIGLVPKNVLTDKIDSLL